MEVSAGDEMPEYVSLIDQIQIEIEKDEEPDPVGILYTEK